MKIPIDEPVAPSLRALHFILTMCYQPIIASNPAFRL